ncbi:hypothetical protein Tco_1109472, partial [Tanacetum coccineum]
GVENVMEANLDRAPKAKDDVVDTNKDTNSATSRFVEHSSPRLALKSQFPNTLSLDQQSDLERDVSYAEIKKAVWDCGINKSLDLDGIFPPGCNSSFIALIPKTQEAKMDKDFCPISLIGSVYKIIAKILANLLSLVISSFVSDVQTAFVSNRQILDGPFIINELLSWTKHKKYKARVFKIQGCLNTAMGSILVNGSPTPEFKIHKGLKRGDTLSHFLFILIMESLHFSFKNMVNAGLYKGIPIDDTLTLSHLFYADDEIKLMGIGIPHNEVVIAAESIGCLTFSTPFNFLGVKVGGIMSRRSSWDEVIAKLTSQLNKWKLKAFSIGGHLTLIKSVLSSLPLYHMSIFKCPMGVLKLLESIRQNFFNSFTNSYRRLALIGWKKVLASKKNGGLGVSSSLDNPHIIPRRYPWLDIIKEFKSLSLKALVPKTFLLELDKQITVASKMRDTSLISSFRRSSRGGIEEEQLRILDNSLGHIILPQISDRWFWNLESSGEFLIKSARAFIDDSLLPKVNAATR